MNQNLVGSGRMIEKLSVIGDLGKLAGLNVVERVGKRHFAIGMVMTVGLAVGGDVHQLVAGTRIGKST